LKVKPCPPPLHIPYVVPIGCDDEEQAISEPQTEDSPQGDQEPLNYPTCKR
jgi:hypothetical protein